MQGSSNCVTSLRDRACCDGPSAVASKATRHAAGTRTSANLERVNIPFVASLLRMMTAAAARSASASPRLKLPRNISSTAPAVAGPRNPHASAAVTHTVPVFDCEASRLLAAYVLGRGVAVALHRRYDVELHSRRWTQRRRICRTRHEGNHEQQRANDTG
jgi:hypothetical protein